MRIIGYFRRCACRPTVPSLRDDEICKLDFSPIWASQDPGATALQISPGSTPDIVTVRYRYPGNNSDIHITYHLSKINGSWRIADIESDASPSLRHLLR